MSQHIDAMFNDGAFYPRQPVHFANGEWVKLTIDSGKNSVVNGTDDADDELSDIADLLSEECVEVCSRNTDPVPSLEEVRRRLSAYKGSFADDLSAERDER
jgi:predicted DNA-binding antitoxin AbrB/MazE fold protein